MIAFLLGLMLGDVFKPQPKFSVNKLVQISVQEQGLKLCFTSIPQVLSGQTQGMYWLAFVQVRGEPAKGQLHLSEQDVVSWRVKRLTEGLQLGFVALQPLQGQWQQLEGGACIDVQVTTAVRD